MNIPVILSYLYPDARPLIDYLVSDDGQGNFSITKWDEGTLGPRPDDQTFSDNEQSALNAQQAKIDREELKTKLIDALTNALLDNPTGTAQDIIAAAVSSVQADLDKAVTSKNVSAMSPPIKVKP